MDVRKITAFVIDPRRANKQEDIMHRSLTAAYAVIFGASILGTAVGGQAQGFRETDLVANKNPLTDSNGVVHTAPIQDPNLLNPWGLTASQTSPLKTHPRSLLTCPPDVRIGSKADICSARRH